MNTIVFNEQTFDFKSKHVPTSKGSFEVIDIFINGKPSIYHLEESYWYVKGLKTEKVFTLFWNGLSSSVEVKDPSNIVELAKVINNILSHSK